MSYNDSSRARAHKLEKQSKSIGLGSSGTTATAAARDARRNAYLMETGGMTPGSVPKATTPKTAAPKTTAPKTTTPKTTAPKTSGYQSVYGSGGLYTAPSGTGGTTAPKTGNTGTSGGGTKRSSGGNTTRGSGGSGVPRATVRSGMSDYDIQLRDRYNRAHDAALEPPKATPYSGMSDYDIQLRQDYNKQIVLDAQQNAWRSIKDEGQTKNSLEEQLKEQRNYYMELIDKANAGGYRMSDHQLRDIRRQLDDIQAQIDMSDDRLAGYRADLEKANETYTGGTWATETKPMDIPQTGDQIDTRLSAIDLEIAALKDQLSDSVGYEDIAGLSKEEYLAGSQKNLEKRQEAEARMLQLMWERERLSDQKNMASKGNSESISKQAETILYDGATEDDLFRDYWFSQKDPTLERKSNFLTQEEQLHNFRDHNYETLYGDSIIPGPLRDYIHDLPGEYKHKAYEGLGKGIGGLVSGRHPVFKDLGEMIADNIDTYNVAFGRSYRGFLLSGVDEETAKSAARDEAFVVTCLNGIGGVAEDLTEKMSEVFVKDAIPQYLIKKGIKAVKNLSDSAMEEIVAEENENRILSGDSDAGIGGLFERVIIRGLFFEGFNEE